MTDNIGTIAAGITSIISFIIAFRYSRLIPVAKAAIVETIGATKLLRDTGMDDDLKEKAIQQASVSLAKYTFLIVTWSIVILSVPVAVIALCHVLHIADYRDVSGLLLSWEILAGASVIAIIILVATDRT